MTNITELALKRYSEFIDTFNKFKLTDNDVDINSFNPTDKLKSFYENISNNEKLFKYLLNRDNFAMGTTWFKSFFATKLFFRIKGQNDANSGQKFLNCFKKQDLKVIKLHPHFFSRKVKLPQTPNIGLALFYRIACIWLDVYHNQSVIPMNNLLYQFWWIIFAKAMLIDSVKQQTLLIAISNLPKIKVNLHFQPDD